MNKPTVAVDIDDVLFPYVLELTEYYNHLKGTSLTIDDYFSYRFRDVWKNTEEEATEIAHAIHHGEFLHIPPIEGSVKALSLLSKQYNLHIVTSRPTIFEQKTKDWVEKHFAGLFSRIDVVGNRYDGSAVRTKVEVCAEIGSSYLIDDQPKYIEECARNGIHGILFGDYGWNRSFELPLGVTRCKDWAAVLEYFKTAAIAKARS